MHAFRWTCWFFAVYVETIKAATNGSSGVFGVDLAFPRNDTYATSQYLPITFAVKNVDLAPYIKPQISFQIWEWDNFTRNEVLGKYDLTQANASSNELYFEYSRRVKFDKEAVWELRWTVGWSSCLNSFPVTDKNFGKTQLISRNVTDQWVMFTTKKSTPTHDLDLVAATKNTDCPETFENKSVSINITNTLKVSESGDWNQGFYRDPDTINKEFDNQFCAVVPSSAPSKTNGCPVEIVPAVATRINAYMDYLDCRATSLATGACELGDNKKSIAQRLATGTAALLGAVFGAIVLIV